VTMTVEERFWAKVKKSEEPDGCWEWQGSRDKDGYGILCVNRKNVRAHRLIWELFNGTIPKGYCICHNCPNGDNPSCVRLEHLFLGTYKDNAQDMVRKGRANPFRSPYSKETLKKMSEAKSGAANPMFGRHHTWEAKEKIGQAHKGRPHPPLTLETKEKLSKALKGRTRHPLTLETKEKISRARKGKPLSLETKEKGRQTRLKNRLAKEIKE
jgi:hypothetical protein